MTIRVSREARCEDATTTDTLHFVLCHVRSCVRNTRADSRWIPPRSKRRLGVGRSSQVRCSRRGTKTYQNHCVHIAGIRAKAGCLRNKSQVVHEGESEWDLQKSGDCCQARPAEAVHVDQLEVGRVLQTGRTE